MSRNLIKPFFARPPAEYDQKYMEQMQNPGEGRHTRLTLTNLPTSDQGLEVGGLFQYRDAAGLPGVVRITSSNQTNLPSISGTGSVGSVTVNIS